MLRTQPIKTVPPPEGRRISVMRRHTLKDGITPDPEITDELYDEWWPELGPPPALIGSYYKRNMPWPVFESGYLAHLRKQAVAVRLGQLINLAMAEDVTILCIEDSPEQCHRRLLAEVCQQLQPKLEVEIN